MPDPVRPSAWAPLRHPAFRAIWIASVVSNIGTWMQQVGAGWLITSLSPSPFVVSLVQAANAVPMCLLALPAGALADILDRRRFLIGTQVWLTCVAGVLAILTFLGSIDATGLLLLTLAMGVGAALMMPAWAAITPDLVPPEELHPAVAMSSVGMNLSRAIGPALAGLIVSAYGAWATFALNALSFLAVIAALARWQAPRTTGPLPSERFFGALRLGMRYARSAPVLQAVLARTFGFFFPAIAGMALLPLVASEHLGGSAGTYGLLLAGIGFGAVVAAGLLPAARRAWSRDTVVALGSLLLAAALVGIALLRSAPLVGLVMLAYGVAWMAVLSSLQVSAQVSAPGWVRARALAVYMLVLFGAMAAGSAAWGAVAAGWSVQDALLVAGVALAVQVPLTWRFSLGDEPGADLSPSLHWPAPIVTEPPAAHHGPVLVTVEYDVDPTEAEAFADAMSEIERARRRNGAVSWGLFNDTAEPRRWLEFFVDESWVEHLRHHDRVTVADLGAEVTAHGFHRGPTAPVVRHHVAPPSGKRRPRSS